MVKCTHKGCNQDFSEQDNKDNACQFHPGAPVFHEGLKGWSCCKKRVIEFDEFLKIPGCTFGRHTDEKPVEEPKTTESTNEASAPTAPSATSITKEGVEVYGQQAPPPSKPATPALPKEEPKQELPVVEEEDDESVPVPPNALCKRKGCGVQYKDDATSRGNGSEAVCVHHPGAPIFHEGSKGWSCCKRRVLEFDEFLKIPGCKEGKHLFVGSQNKEEQMVDCRTDWYQTQTHIILSVFAKNKLDTKVEFDKQSILVDIKMKNNQRYQKKFDLFHYIEPENSKYTALTTKVEISLKKTSGISWASLEPTSEVKTWTTFGVTGGGGSVGAKEMIYISDSPLHLNEKK
ncbi:chord-domain-containing protein [Dichotomocladium elegans]|nr:chord-domain-containing protein [Dichotomocladium elegans]